MSWLLKILEFLNFSRMTEEEEEAFKDWSSLNEIEDYEKWGSSKTEPDFSGLIEFEGEIESRDIINSILVSLGEKNGGEFSGKLSVSRLEDFERGMKDAGLNCLIGYGRESDDEIVFDVFFTKEEFPEDFHSMVEDPDFSEYEYHLEMGKFFGYDKDSIKAFLEERRDTEVLGGRLMPKERTPNVLDGVSIIEEYCEDSDCSEKEYLADLMVFRVFENSKKGYKKCLDLVDKRKSVLVDNGFREQLDCLNELGV